MTNYTIRPIVTGHVSTSKGLYLYHHSTHQYKNVQIESQLHKGEGDVKIPDIAYLIKGNNKLILVDTGMSDSEHATKYHHPGFQPRGYAIHERLKAMDISPEQINIVIFTHLHWDHCYYMDKFVNAKFIVQRKEYEFALNPIPVYYKSYEHPSLGIRRPFEGIKFDLVDGEEEILEGVKVFPSPGHSPGHQSVEIDTAIGKYICCGDSIFIHENLDPIKEINYSITPPARYTNIVETWKSIEELKERAKSREFILPAHEHEIEKMITKQEILGIV